MRRLAPQWRFWLALILLVTGCTLNNAATSGTTVSGAPTVRILAPQPNATYMEGVTVNLQATVANAGKDIDRVEIVIDGATVATLSQPNTAGAASFNVTHGWAAAGTGTHSIDVIAYRADGTSSAPAAVTITVVAANGQSSNPTQAPVVGNTAAPTQAATPAGGDQATTAAVPPTAAPTTEAATATPSTPMASFAQGINVRRGPALEFDPPIGAFAAGQTTEILAVNPAGTWYKVRYGSGEGWVYAALTQASGDIAALPRDSGPPVPTALPPTAVPPTSIPATAVPASDANLVAGIVELNPGQPSCQQTFNIGFDVANLGSVATSASGTVSVQDVRSADGSVQQTTIGGFPVLQPGQTFRVDMPLTVSTWYNEEHTIIMIIDPDNQIAESEKGDNRREVRYTLQKGNC